MKTTRVKYTAEYKIKAIELGNQIGVQAAADKLGISSVRIYDWRKKVLKQGETNVFPGNGKLNPDFERVRSLERENKRLREDLEILKKATAFFVGRSK
jgi:transposase